MRKPLCLLALLVAATLGSTVTLAQPPAQGAAALPGIKSTESQLIAAAAEVRAGRKLLPKAWPNGAKVAVCLSFDIDNESPLMARDLAPLPVPMSETEYGAVEAMPRILAMLDKEKLPASFYVPAVSAILAPEMVPAIVKGGRHEIALHGWIHESLPALNNEAEEERLLKQSLDYFEKVTGKRPVGTRAGAWAFSHHTMGILLRSGLLYDSSMMAMDAPYLLKANGKETSLIELPVSWVLDDAPYFTRTGALPSPEAIFKVYQDEFDLAYREGGMLMLTFHPHIVGRRSRMVHLEKLVTYMKSKPNVWFATAEQIANHVKPTAGSTSR